MLMRLISIDKSGLNRRMFTTKVELQLDMLRNDRNPLSIYILFSYEAKIKLTRDPIAFIS